MADGTITVTRNTSMSAEIFSAGGVVADNTLVVAFDDAMEESLLMILFERAKILALKAMQRTSID